MKYLRGPIATLLAFLFGVAVSPIQFEPQGMGYGRMIESGRGYSITTYRSSYFISLAFAHADHGSPQKANAVYDETLAEAVRVLEDSPKLDEHGNEVGRRGVAIFFDKETNQSFASVFWTKGPLLHSINSRSLIHCLQFEKQNVLD
jgi:hypothetical protein